MTRERFQRRQRVELQQSRAAARETCPDDLLGLQRRSRCRDDGGDPRVEGVQPVLCLGGIQCQRVSDEMLDVVGVSGTLAAVGRRLRERNAFADRTSLVLYNETEAEAVIDLMRGFKGA